MRVLIFLAQTALVVQGYDPGKPDGVMGPNTMLALLAWHAKSGEPLWIGLSSTVAYLLHGTLRTMGFEPGPRQQFLGHQSKAGLERWDGTFRWGATQIAVFDGDPEAARDSVLKSFGRTPLPDAQLTANQA